MGNVNFINYNLIFRNIVKQYSLKLNNSFYLVPGSEYLNLYGLENLKNHLINCCLNYTIQETENSFDVIASFTPEDFYEFYDRNENVTQILFNPSLTNEKLFFNYGINYIGDNLLDYYNLNVTELILNNILIKDNSKIEPSISVDYLKLSCNEYDIKNLLYFLHNFSQEYIEENFINIINLLKEKIFNIERLFEQSFHQDNMEEVVESFKYLSNKQNFLNKLIKCLESKYPNTGNNQLSKEMGNNLTSNLIQENESFKRDEL